MADPTTNLISIRFFLVLSVVAYLVFDYVDGRRVKDEREELIRLKTFELVGKITTVTVSLLAVFYVFMPGMDALIPLCAIIGASMYAEMLGKAYYRRKL